MLDRLDGTRPVLRALAEARADVTLRRRMAPHADPAERCPEAMAQAAKVRVHEEQRTRERVAMEAREAAERAAAALPSQARALAAMGIAVPAQVEADGLAVRAARLTEMAEHVRPTRGVLDDAAGHARVFAHHHALAYADWQRTKGKLLDAREAALDSIERLVRTRGPRALAAIRRYGLEELLEAETERLAWPAEATPKTAGLAAPLSVGPRQPMSGM